MSLEVLSTVRCSCAGAPLIEQNTTFGGSLTKYKLISAALGGLATQFNVFLPKQARAGNPVPVLYYLAGLTCNEDTGAHKGGFIRDAAAEAIAIVFPDTSPRGAAAPGEDDSWDFGTGAGFYLDATVPSFSKHYNMYDHVVHELPKVIAASGLPIDGTRASIFGHSMGGHGALTAYLKNHSAYRSASAFAPICNPTKAPWGEKAFGGYLAGGVAEGAAYDATELLSEAKGKQVNILIDVGLADDFYKKGQLLPENFVAAAKAASFSEADVQVNLHEGYDHSYYFISTFAPSHVAFHAKYLKA